MHDAASGKMGSLRPLVAKFKNGRFGPLAELCKGRYLRSADNVYEIATIGKRQVCPHSRSLSGANRRLRRPVFGSKLKRICAGSKPTVLHRPFWAGLDSEIGFGI